MLQQGSWTGPGALAMGLASLGAVEQLGACLVDSHLSDQEMNVDLA